MQVAPLHTVFEAFSGPSDPLHTACCGRGGVDLKYVWSLQESRPSPGIDVERSNLLNASSWREEARQRQLARHNPRPWNSLGRGYVGFRV